MEEPIFLTLDHVLRLHERQIERFGGSGGVRDVELIESAIAQPRQSFNGQYLHGGVIEMAAAYLYHLCKNHGFVDGNKRVAAASALVFLEINGIDTDPIDESAMEAIVLGTAEGRLDKKSVAEFFRTNVNLKDDG
ncbi:MAG TPA: Fic family protein [Tepidisphaeraceae bacterium]|nr:Fic family protein [Tepidisphaeraceae bacterium]